MILATLHKRQKLLLVSIGIIVSLVAWTASVVFAAVPQPNPLAPLTPGANPYFAPVPGADLTQNGPAASIHGDPGKGRVLFAKNCVTCHNDRGIGNIPNPGSSDGTVPPLNPLDPGFLDQSKGDPAVFAQAIDVFIQHGSRPAGDNPQLSMVGWGDHKLLSQTDLADIEAYVMQLNGVYWPDRWAPPAEVRMTAQRDVDGDEILYTITLVNHSAGVLSGLDLIDTLPSGLSYGDSSFPTAGQNPGKVVGSSVEWNNQGGVPQGGDARSFHHPGEHSAGCARSGQRRAVELYVDVVGRLPAQVDGRLRAGTAAESQAGGEAADHGDDAGWREPDRAGGSHGGPDSAARRDRVSEREGDRDGVSATADAHAASANGHSPSSSANAGQLRHPGRAAESGGSVLGIRSALDHDSRRR